MFTTPRWIIRFAFLLTLPLASCGREDISKTSFSFGTVCNIRVYERLNAAALDAVFERLAQIERLFSPNIPESDISKVNSNAGIAPVPVSNETAFVLKAALRTAELSGGAFDPSIGPLVKLWGIGTDNERIPLDDEIAAALALVDWRRVHIDQSPADGSAVASESVFLETAGMALDLGAIVKGYAADEAARMLRDAGVQRAIIDFGGNIAALGQKRHGGLSPREEPWRIGIQNPSERRGVYAAVIPCADATLVTSGIYERFFESDDKRYHHILSTKTGYPADNELASVTIIMPLAGHGAAAGALYASMTADALSTTVFALGREEGERFLKANYPDADSVFILKTGEIIR
ncbi:MAG: FAD:protein FMN transferase [Spirochaetaceae bacterium]|jgi:thiamine biosynthesis lipoprotein|nr:FAD:protein FMN transferase [Spirochaetaceae bacterium]